MSFLRKSLDGEEQDQNELMEEQYERLFAKIGRDFVFIGDLKRILNQIQEGAGESFVPTEARSRAAEYKSLLDAGRDGSKLYEDLLDMSED